MLRKNSRLLCYIMMFLLCVTSCGNKDLSDSGKKGTEEELKDSDINIDLNYDKSVVEKYSDWFEGDHFRNWGNDEWIPEELLSEISTECLFYDVLPRSNHLGEVVWKSEFVGLAISSCSYYPEFKELFNREDAWISAYAFIMDNAENENMKDINKQWVKDMATVSVNYSEDYTAPDPEEVDVEGEKRFQEMNMFVVAQYILTKDISFDNMPDNMKKNVINKIIDIYDKEGDLYGFYAQNDCIFNLIIEEENEKWIDFIDENELLGSGWKKDYDKIAQMGSLGENWRDENEYWKTLR